MGVRKGLVLVTNMMPQSTFRWILPMFVIPFYDLNHLFMFSFLMIGFNVAGCEEEGERTCILGGRFEEERTGWFMPMKFIFSLCMVYLMCNYLFIYL